MPAYLVMPKHGQWYCIMLKASHVAIWAAQYWNAAVRELFPFVWEYWPRALYEVWYELKKIGRWEPVEKRGPLRAGHFIYLPQEEILRKTLFGNTQHQWKLEDPLPVSDKVCPIHHFDQIAWKWFQMWVRSAWFAMCPHAKLYWTHFTDLATAIAGIVNLNQRKVSFLKHEDRWHFIFFPKWDRLSPLVEDGREFWFQECRTLIACYDNRPLLEYIQQRWQKMHSTLMLRLGRRDCLQGGNRKEIEFFSGGSDPNYPEQRFAYSEGKLIIEVNCSPDFTMEFAWDPSQPVPQSVQPWLLRPEDVDHYWYTCWLRVCIHYLTHYRPRQNLLEQLPTVQQELEKAEKHPVHRAVPSPERSIWKLYSQC